MSTQGEHFKQDQENCQKEGNVEGLIGYKLKKTQHALRLHMDEALKTLHLTTPQYSVLAQLELKSGLSSAELARSSFITAQTMQGIIINLEKRHLVQRQKSTSHGKILSINLTKEGHRLVQQAHSMIHDIEKAMFFGFSKDQKKLLEDLLLRCFYNLHQEKKELQL